MRGRVEMRFPGLVLTATLVFAAQTASAHVISGTVIAVVDGDTVDVLTDGGWVERVRIAAIDTPERAQPFGGAAKHALSELVFRRRVAVDWHKRDYWMRIVGKVVVPGDSRCNAEACLQGTDAGR